MRYITNFFLVLFAVGALFALFKYTDILDIGVTSSLDEGIQSLKRIIQEQPPRSELSESEKNKLKQTLDDTRGFTSFYCGSTFFPFIPGSSWSYQVTSGNDKDVIKIGIPSPENGLIYLDGRLASRQKWTIRTISQCQGNKIRLTDLNFLLIFTRDRTVTTPCQKDQYNFSLPRDADLIKGNSWYEEGCLVHDVLDENYNEKKEEIKENLGVKGIILGQEEVNIPSGTYKAEKIGLSISNKQDTPEGLKTIESNIDFWAVQGIGIVKAVYQDKSGRKPAVVQELLGYQIPTDMGNKLK